MSLSFRRSLKSRNEYRVEAPSDFLSTPHNSSRLKISWVKRLTSCVVKISWLLVVAPQAFRKYWSNLSNSRVCKQRSRSSITKTTSLPFCKLAKTGTRSSILRVPSDSSFNKNTISSPSRFLWTVHSFSKNSSSFSFLAMRFLMRRTSLVWRIFEFLASHWLRDCYWVRSQCWRQVPRRQ